MARFWAWAVLAGVLLAGLAGPTPGWAAASCDIGVHDGACATKNGYYRIRKPAGAGPWPAVVYLYGSLGNSARSFRTRASCRPSSIAATR